MHGTSLLSTPLPLWTSIITLGKKNDDEKTLLLKKKLSLGIRISITLKTGFHLKNECYLTHLLGF